MGCGLEVKGKVLRRLEDQLLPVPKEERKRPYLQGKEKPKIDPRVQVGETDPSTRLKVEFCFGVSPTIKLLMVVVEEEVEVPKTAWSFPGTSVAASHLISHWGRPTLEAVASGMVWALGSCL